MVQVSVLPPLRQWEGRHLRCPHPHDITQHVFPVVDGHGGEAVTTLSQSVQKVGSVVSDPLHPHLVLYKAAGEHVVGQLVASTLGLGGGLTKFW